MPENKFHVTDAQLQDILKNENFGIECDETNDTSIHAIVSDLVNLREQAKNAARLAKIEVLEKLRGKITVSGNWVSKEIDAMVFELKAGGK